MVQEVLPSVTDVNVLCMPDTLDRQGVSSYRMLAVYLSRERSVRYSITDHQFQVQSSIHLPPNIFRISTAKLMPHAVTKQHKPGDSTAAAEAKDSGNAQPTAAAAATAVANDVESSAEESKMEVDGDGAAAAATAAGAAAAALLDGGAANAGPDGAGRGTGAGAGDDASATAASDKYEWVKIPEPVVQHERLRLLCSVLRLESCSDSSFQVWMLLLLLCWEIGVGRSCNLFITLC